MNPWQDRYRHLLHYLPDSFAYHQIIADGSSNPVDYIFLEVNPAFEQMTGLSREQVIGKKATELHPRIENSDFDWIGTFGKVALTGENASFEHYFDTSDRWYAVTAYSDEPGYFAVFFRDITEVKQAKAEQRSIEWMLDTGKIESLKDTLAQSEPSYGSLTQLNTSRFILDSIGEDMLVDIAKDYLGLLETSTAIYEKNGDYALGIFSSGWCRFLDNASRWLCQTDDNRVALQSGKWLCHESCWADAAKTAIETGQPVDIACHGGLNLYTVPIWANHEVVGSINFGYGDPPQEPAELQKIADKYAVDSDELRKHAEANEPRPPFIIHIAKERLHSSAKLIGTMLERKQAEEALRESEETHRRLFETIAQGVIYQAADGTIISANPAAERILCLSFEQMQGKTSMDPRWQMIEEDGTAVPGTEHPAMIALRTGKVVGPVTRGIFRPDKNDYVWLNITAIPLFQPGGTEPFQAYATFDDITKRKQAEETLQAERDLSQRYLDTVETIIVSLDASGNVSMLNRYGLELLGYSAEQIMGKNWFAMVLLQPEGMEKVYPVFRQIMQGELDAVRYFENELLTASGKRRLIAWHNNYIHDANGHVIGTLSSGMDITERKEMEEALRQRLLELEALYTVSSALRSAETLDEMLTILIDETLKILGTEDGAVCLYHSTKEALRFTATRGWFNQLDDAWLKPEEGIAGEVFVSGQVLVSREFAKDSRVKYIESVPEGCGGACLPMRTAEDVVGTMFVSVPLPREITREELNLLASLSEMASTAIHRISLFQETVNLLENLQELNMELLLAYDATLEGWSRALELRDHETEGHSARVTDKTIQIALLLNVPDDELVHIRRGSLLHDIGKIGIPDAVLLKPGKLSPQEWALMQQHPRLAYELLSPVDYLYPALDIPYCHHEKWDGSGYPRGLKGKEIPLAARIFAVVDVYDALTSDRPYRLAWSKQETLEYISEQSGKHFDPQVVEVFLKIGLTH